MVTFAARDVRPHPEERGRRRSSASSNARARVSKEEDGRLFALMLRDASQRASAAEAFALASRCDAPQHEGREAPTCGCTKTAPGQFRCFRLLFTMTFATHTCRAAEGQICYPKCVTPYLTHDVAPSLVIPIVIPCVTIRRHNVLCI
jgi:hypothetical protein